MNGGDSRRVLRTGSARTRTSAYYCWHGNHHGSGHTVLPLIAWDKEDRRLRDRTNVGTTTCFSLEDCCHEVTCFKCSLKRRVIVLVFCDVFISMSDWQEPERLSLWDLWPPTASSALPLIISSFISIGRDVHRRCSRGKMFGKLSELCFVLARWSEVTNSPWMVKAKRFFFF